MAPTTVENAATSATELVSGLAQPQRVPLPQGLLNCGQMVRQQARKP